MRDFQGPPSDELPEVLAYGSTDIVVAVLSMSRRSPTGDDADYLEWHCLDHLPEQFRLRAIRLGMRLVSTPACRAARAAGHERYDPVDHIVHYLFDDPAALPPFFELGVSLGQAGRMGVRLPRHEVGGYDVAGMAANRRAVVGADVVPWRPATGVYVLIETGEPARPPTEVCEVAGVAGVWWYRGRPSTYRNFTDTTGLHLALCYLDDDPVATAGRLADALAPRWSSGATQPLLAAPFHTVVPFAWDRFVP